MIAEVAATGDRRKTLEAMRDKLARDMDEAPPAVVAQIAGRLSAILTELDEMPDTEKRSTLDELVARRANRIAAAESVEPAKQSLRQRR